MKRNLLLGLSATVIIFLSSCRGYVTSPDYVDLQGRWRLQSIERQGSFGWENVYSDYQQGTFYFSGGGSVSYNDVYGNMNGTWFLRNIGGGHYDANGNYLQYPRFTLSMDLYSNNSSDRINWDFDDCEFNGYYQFTASYQTAFYTYQYQFVRQ
jgi:hypothetical protein